MPSDTVQTQGSTGLDSQSFTQNGQVDWVAFGKTIWSISSAVLQRFASAGVQPITFGAGLALASGFNLDRVGKQRMHGALEKAQGIWSFEKVLLFGFGTRSFLRVLEDAQFGVNCIALCSSLSEIHNEHVAAWILDELWKIYEYPPQYLPSHSQLVALVRASSGVLTRTEFSSTCDCMLNHTPYPRPAISDRVANIDDIAKALRGLFRISKGEIARITVIGGGMECAFIAGFAQWILNLRVYVDDETGRIIYQNSDFEEAQLVVTYGQQVDLPLVQISSTTYILRDDEEIFVRTASLDHVLLVIRTPWDGCLARVFGTAFDALTKAPTVLGGFLGSVARVYHALALGERDVGELSRRTFINFVESSYGVGYINSVVSIFPELKKDSGLFDAMQLALNVPLKEALSTTERTLLELQQICQCRKCTPGSTSLKITCMVVLAVSIREMVSTISCVIREDDILPTIRGMQCVYRRQDLDGPLSANARRRPLFAIALGLSMEGLSGPDNNDNRTVDLLSHPMEIFSGHSEFLYYWPENTAFASDYRTATVKQGLCYYLNCLQSLSSDAENARVVHIIAGHVEMDDKQFISVYDSGDFSNTRLSPIQIDVLQESDNASIIRQPQQVDVKLELFGLEKATDHELVVYYRAMVPGEPAITLRPGLISYRVLEGTGRVTCEGTHCTSQTVLPCALVRRGWRMLLGESDPWVVSRSGDICLIWPQLKDVARCVAIEELSTGGNVAVLRRSACISCCTVSLVRERVEGPRTYKSIFHLI